MTDAKNPSCAVRPTKTCNHTSCTQTVAPPEDDTVIAELAQHDPVQAMLVKLGVPRFSLRIQIQLLQSTSAVPSICC